VVSDQSPAICVCWAGTFLDSGSLSYVNRELTKALSRFPFLATHRVGDNRLNGLLANCAEMQAISREIRSRPLPETQITVRHGWPADWKPLARGPLVVIQSWEYGSLPKKWVEQSAQVTEFWVPSRHVREVYVESGVTAEKVKVVPNGVDPTRFNPGVAPMSLPTRKSFKFLFVGGTINRKGPDALLNAYLQAFTAGDDVCLIIKDVGAQSFYADQNVAEGIKAIQALPKAPEIVYLNEELPGEVLPGLYTACDCLVHPYRGEGFGLPILEAMASGLPVVVTAGGAADDFAIEEYAYRIPATKQTIGGDLDGEPLAGMGWLLEPDVGALAGRMKWVFEHRDEAGALGDRAGAHARRCWSWDRAAEIAAGRLRELTRNAEC
jgi:glycosyltransferase involved in cell wall biosynthesis